MFTTPGLLGSVMLQGHLRICFVWLCDEATLKLAFLQELLLSYNIGIDRDVRQRKMVQSTAARVGLRLPITDDGQEGYAELQGGSESSKG